MKELSSLIYCNLLIWVDLSQLSALTTVLVLNVEVCSIIHSSIRSETP